MSQLDRLPDTTIQRRMNALASRSRELKGSFQMVGSRGIRTKRIFSSAAYDYQATPNTSAPNQPHVHRVDVEFIPDDTRFGGALALSCGVLATYTNGQKIDRWQVVSERRVTENKKQIWSFYYVTLGFAEEAARFKFYIFALGSGSFTVNVIS